MKSTKDNCETWNMQVKRGDKWPAWCFLLQDETGADITTFDVKMQVKAKATDSVYAKQLVPGTGFAVSGNQVTFDTNVDIPVADYVYDIQIILGDGSVETIYAGIVSVTQDVTR